MKFREQTEERMFSRELEKMNSLLVVYLLLAFFCGSTEFEHSVSVNSNPVYPPAVKNVTFNVIENCGRGVNTHLTWELMAFNASFQPLFSVSDLMATGGMKGQLCLRLDEHSTFKMRVARFGWKLNALAHKNVFSDIAEEFWSLRRLRKKLCCGNCRVYYMPSSRRQKRRFRLRFHFSTRNVEQILDCNAEGSECIQDRFEVALNYLFQIVFVFAVECVILYETPGLFFGNLPLFEFFMAAVITVTYASFQTSYKWFKVQTKRKQLQSLGSFLDDKILHLESIAHKDKLTYEECLTLQIELPGLLIFTRELKDLANQLHPGLGNFPSMLYSTKLISIESAMNYHISKQFPECSCVCQKSNCWVQKEYERLQELSEEIQEFEYDFLSLACLKPSLRQGADIQALIHKCEKFVEKLSSVTPGELCNNTVRSYRKLLVTRAETLDSKLLLMLKEKPLNKDITSDEEMMGDVNVNLYRHGGGRQCCIAGCQNGASMHSVTHLQGKYEIDLEKANEPWLLYVCNSHFETDR